MTRAEVKEFLISAGIAEPTEESISNFLNKHQSEVQKEKELANKYKTEATKVSELQAKLDEISNQNLSDIEKAQKETEKSNARVADLEKQIAIMQRKNALAEKGIVGEVADKLFGEDGSLDIEMLGKIISDRETQARAKAEKDLLDRTPNPSGGKADPSVEETKVDAMAKSVGKEIASMNQASTDILSNYIK